MGLLPQPHTSSSTPWAAAFPEVPPPRSPCRAPVNPPTATAVHRGHTNSLGPKCFPCCGSTGHMKRSHRHTEDSGGRRMSRPRARPVQVFLVCGGQMVWLQVLWAQHPSLPPYFLRRQGGFLFMAGFEKCCGYVVLATTPVLSQVD